MNKTSSSFLSAEDIQTLYERRYLLKFQMSALSACYGLKSEQIKSLLQTLPTPQEQSWEDLRSEIAQNLHRDKTESL